VGKVLLDVTMSLDGFMAGPSVSAERPMGEGGERLHEWLFKAPRSDVDAEVEREMHETTGAVVLGRRTFDVGVGVWEDTPFPVPCFVLTHEPLDERVEKSGTFTFVTDVESAFLRATSAAGQKEVRLMGAEVSQQFLEAGLVDEIRIQLAPVLMGDGRRLFDHLGTERIELERTAVLESPHVTHLRFHVVKQELAES
jgi:dihydrofolate reductase